MSLYCKQRRGMRMICLWVMLIVAVLLCPARAQENESRTLRVAYPIQPGLTNVDQNGNYSGYTYEYLQEIAQYTGWNYEFVQLPGTLNETLSQMLEMVKNGEIDLIGAMLYSESLGSQYSYSSHSYGTSETVLQALAEDTRHLAVNSQVFSTMRVAVLSHSSRLREELSSYCTMNRIEPEYILCSSEDEQLQALRDGKADVMLNTSLNYVEGLKTVARFSPKPFYFASGKNSDPDIIARLNEAMIQIEQTDPTFASTLFEKYFSPQHTTLELSDDEKKYIRSVGRLRVGVLSSRPPFEYRNPETGELCGISISLLRLIEDKTGLQFDLVAVDSTDALYKMAENDEIDLVASMTYDYNLAQQHQLAMTRPFVSTQYILVASESLNTSVLSGRRLALPKDSAYDGYFVGSVTRYADIDACIRAVSRGEADYTYTDGYTAQYYINLPEYGRLKLIPQTYEPRNVCFGVVKPGHHQLLGIINKAIITMPMEQLQSIIYQNTVLRKDFSFKYFLLSNPGQAIGIILAVSLLIILILVCGLFQRSRLNRKMSLELRKHLRIYALVNDYFFEYDYQTLRLTLSIPQGQPENPSQVCEYDFSVPPKPNMARCREEFLAMIAPGQDGCREVCLHCVDHRTHWIRLILETVYDDNGLLAYSIGKINNIDKEIEERQALIKQAQRDSLTHLLNAETSHHQIAECIATLTQAQHGALILLDIDYFKVINDTYGHQRGDYAISAVADILSRSFRTDDIVGRPGGDEFIVYMKNIPCRETLEEKCAYLCDQLRQISIDQHTLSASIGAYVANIGVSYQEAYKKADQALYLAKKNGRDRFEIAE